jgi:hypothetical protein
VSYHFVSLFRFHADSPWWCLGGEINRGAESHEFRGRRFFFEQLAINQVRLIGPAGAATCLHLIRLRGDIEITGGVPGRSKVMAAQSGK